MRRSAHGVGFCGHAAAMQQSARFVSFPFSDMKRTATPKTAQPVETFRHRGLSVSVFENTSEDGQTVYHKVSLQRTYRQDDEWKTTQSLSRDDLPIAALLLQKAWEYVLEAEGK